jgi:hypothetical protein
VLVPLRGLPSYAIILVPFPLSFSEYSLCVRKVRPRNDSPSHSDSLPLECTVSVTIPTAGRKSYMSHEKIFSRSERPSAAE